MDSWEGDFLPLEKRQTLKDALLSMQHGTLTSDAALLLDLCSEGRKRQDDLKVVAEMLLETHQTEG